ncbi:serine-rich adhesin for platelets-like isoform X2 [Watersipora subatra]|uniref:serine-rich adhesin for platelets-like isoform X2 n=1 Tax=Watersipora subatra TaxID=2589382 RepID=UPI00355B64C4
MTTDKLLKTTFGGNLVTTQESLMTSDTDLTSTTTGQTFEDTKTGMATSLTDETLEIRTDTPKIGVALVAMTTDHASEIVSGTGPATTNTHLAYEEATNIGEHVIRTDHLLETRRLLTTTDIDRVVEVNKSTSQATETDLGTTKHSLDSSGQSVNTTADFDLVASSDDPTTNINLSAVITETHQQVATREMVMNGPDKHGTIQDVHQTVDTTASSLSTQRALPETPTTVNTASSLRTNEYSTVADIAKDTLQVLSANQGNVSTERAIRLDTTASSTFRSLSDSARQATATAGNKSDAMRVTTGKSTTQKESLLNARQTSLQSVMATRIHSMPVQHLVIPTTVGQKLPSNNQTDHDKTSKQAIPQSSLGETPHQERTTIATPLNSTTQDIRVSRDANVSAIAATSDTSYLTRINSLPSFKKASEKHLFTKLEKNDATTASGSLTTGTIDMDGTILMTDEQGYTESLTPIEIQKKFDVKSPMKHRNMRWVHMETF